MIIAIDESGTFVYTESDNSWSVVSGYVYNERIKSKLITCLDDLKTRCGYTKREEIKLKHTSEDNYFRFLHDLNEAGGLLFCVATDAAHNDIVSVVKHREGTCKNIRENIPRMIYESGKEGVKKVADEVESLSNQLYVQLNCQVELIHEIVSYGLLYFVQKDPRSLRRFKWVVDQKNTSKTVFEKAFEKVVCPMVQSKSFREPMIRLVGADYSYFKDFEYSENEVPKYIEEALGEPVKEGVNIGKIILDDLSFPDSKDNKSIQIADLLASGIRKCLRNEFERNEIAAGLLGSLMVGQKKDRNSMKVIKLSESEAFLDAEVSRIIKFMDRHSKPMVMHTNI